jgi:Holliday junction DNA helicase RuvA
MIGRLRGRVWECEPGRVLLDVNGTGYELQVSLNTYYSLSDHPGAEIDLLVITHVRADAITLFGFSLAAERAMFQNLTAISGVGPRLALATLSGIGIDELRKAVLDNDQRRIQRIPGIGKKTAARMVLEWRDRIEKDPGAALQAGTVEGDKAGTWHHTIREDAVSALCNLGYAEEAAGRTVDKILKEQQEADGELELQDVLRTALKGLTR